MKKTLFALLLLFGWAGLTFAFPQEKSKSEEAPEKSKTEEKSKAEEKLKVKEKEKSESPIPLRVQLVFTEYDGDKKVTSLPYSFFVNAEERRARPNTQIRDGVRIAVPTGKDSAQYQYIDVGTNIDCSAQSQDDGRYKLILSLERSSFSQETSTSSLPIIRTFRTEINPILKDGQTFEGVMATDPMNGHVYRVTVTLNVPK